LEHKNVGTHSQPPSPAQAQITNKPSTLKPLTLKPYQSNLMDLDDNGYTRSSLTNNGIIATKIFEDISKNKSSFTIIEYNKYDNLFECIKTAINDALNMNIDQCSVNELKKSKSIDSILTEISNYTDVSVLLLDVNGQVNYTFFKIGNPLIVMQLCGPTVRVWDCRTAQERYHACPACKFRVFDVAESIDCKKCYETTHSWCAYALIRDKYKGIHV